MGVCWGIVFSVFWRQLDSQRLNISYDLLISELSEGKQCGVP